MASWDEEEQMEALLGGTAVSDKKRVGDTEEGLGHILLFPDMPLGIWNPPEPFGGLPKGYRSQFNLFI